jgi:uncharacterized membrane protein YdjX (TVP38/TMEM64 family)
VDGKTGSLPIRLIKFLPVVGVAVFVTAYFVAGRSISVNTLLNYTPKNLYFAALFMMALFAAKSMTIFFPIIILEVLGGIIFPTGIAIIINIVGNMITYSLPYLFGLLTGSDIKTFLIKKQPKLQVIYDLKIRSKWFLSFFLRAISCLPGDLVSIYLGANEIPYFIFITGSILGSLVAILAATIIGATILNPTSPAFIISVIIRISIALSSLVFYRLYNKKRRVN